MRNVKFISLFAACGFILSFVFGLFSHSSFISVLLKALFFSAIFVGLGFLISFIFNKYLDDPAITENTSSELSDLGNKTNNDSRPGQHIDVVVEDEDLPEGDTDNHFVVGDNHQMLKNTDIKEDSSSSAIDVGDNDNHFVPLRKTENPDDFSGTEASSPNVAQNSESSQNETLEISDDELDTLPDMDSIAFNQENNSDEDDNSSYIDSGFSSSANIYKKSDGSVPDVKDASLIAKAISTALAEEDS